MGAKLYQCRLAARLPGAASSQLQQLLLLSYWPRPAASMFHPTPRLQRVGRSCVAQDGMPPVMVPAAQWTRGCHK